MKFPRRSFGSLPSPLLGRPLLYVSLYCLLHETAVPTRSRPGSYELRSAPWYAYMHVVHVLYVCMHTCQSYRDAAVRRSLAMEGHRVKKRSAPPRFSFRVSVGPPIPPSSVNMSASHACTHRIVHIHGLGATKFGSDPRLPFLESVARAGPRGTVYYAHFFKVSSSLSLKPDVYARRVL